MTARTDKPRVERLGIIDESVAALTSRPLRTALTALGTVLGVGVLVAVLGLTASAAAQIDATFTELAATEVTITQRPDGTATRTMAFPDDFTDRVERIDGVRRAGLTWRVPAQQAAATLIGVPETNARRHLGGDVLAVSTDALEVARVTMRSGRTYDEYADRSQARVAIIGAPVARELGLRDVSGQPALQIGGTTFTVIGILASVERHPELLNAIAVPTATARGLWGDPAPDEPAVGWVEVEPGAGQVVAGQLAVAIAPERPDRLEVVPPPDPRHLRGSISADLQVLFLLLAVVCVIVGMVGIANTTFVTVMERIGEIGLRRAMGARRIHIAVQFLVEAVVIGIGGGLAGTLTGMGVVVVVALAQGWTAVLPTALIPLGPAIGGATALVAALYPALRAASTEPVTALRAS